jgi:hypothetical protein
MKAASEILFRKANHADIPFLIDTIVEAEKSGSDIFSYSNIFEISENDIRNIFADILAEDVQGQELCVSDYLIAESDGKLAGAVAAWIEGENGQPSRMIKATLLNYFFPKGSMEKAQTKRKYLDQMNFHPDMGIIVVDIGLTVPAFRGQGILAKLMLEQNRLLHERRPDIKISQTHVLKTNPVSYKICIKIGYEVKQEKICHDPVILQWLPADTRIIMEKKL